MTTLFEVWQDGECKMGTDHVECITYSPAVLKTMKEAGCTFKWQGKKITLPALVAELEKIKAPKKAGRKSK